MTTSPASLKLPLGRSRTSERRSSRTILFNDDHHTFEEVARQLVKAVGCNFDQGLALANVAHHTGSAIVFSGSAVECEAVATVLEDIGLRTAVET